MNVLYKEVRSNIRGGLIEVQPAGEDVLSSIQVVEWVNGMGFDISISRGKDLIEISLLEEEVVAMFDLIKSLGE